MILKSAAVMLSLTHSIRSTTVPMSLRTLVRQAAHAVGLRSGQAARLHAILAEVWTVVADREGRTRVDPREAALEEARHVAETWRLQAEEGERRIAELEAALAASDVTAMELRSRVVCLHGKLATSTATVRYQTLTMALEHPGSRVIEAEETGRRDMAEPSRA